MATYTIEEFTDVAKYSRYFKEDRARQKARLQRNINRATKYQKDLAKLNGNDFVEAKAESRLITLQRLAGEQGLVFGTKATKTMTSFARNKGNTVYQKGDVKIEGLSSEVTVEPDGSVSLDVYKIPKDKADSWYYRPRAADKVIRIFVSEQTRITNNVLRTLLKT